MWRRLRASESAGTIYDIDYDRLRALGKRALLFDVDNTLGERGMKTLPERSLRLVLSLVERGFRVGILTNRKRNADDPAVLTLREHIPVIHAAGKPRRSGFRELLAALDAAPEEAVMIGDRCLTDVLGANRLGIYSIQIRSTAARVTADRADPESESECLPTSTADRARRGGCHRGC